MADAVYRSILLISQKWPAARSVPDEWAEVVKLAKGGKAAQADALAASIVHARQKLIVRNKIAVSHRAMRRAYLIKQRELEKQIELLFRSMAALFEKWILNAADDSGKIPLWKINVLVDRMKKTNTEVFRRVLVLIRGGIRDAVAAGIDNNMASSQIGLKHHIKMRESGVVEAERKAILTSDLYDKIFDAVAQRRIKQGLFKNRKRGVIQTGKPISQSVWDMRDAHLRRMRDVVSAGIASGKSPGSIASDIKKYTVMGSAPRGIVDYPGAGAYRTAFKNALRLVRTETNNAYHEADIAYAAEKGYKKMWNVSVGKRDEDECDELAGQIFDPENVPALPHPNAVLEGTTFCSYGKLVEMVGSFYQGPAVKILSTHGHELTIGANHPVMTTRGFVKACDLCESDELIYDLRHKSGNRVFSSNSNFKKVPSVENVFKSLLAFGDLTHVATARHDLHGDRIFCKGKIKVVKPANCLLPVSDSCGVEKFGECGFPETDMQKVVSSGQRSADFNRVGVSLTSSRRMGRATVCRHFVPLGIKSIHYIRFSGQCFDATTKSGIYNSNGFVVKNCSCYLTTVIPEVS